MWQPYLENLGSNWIRLVEKERFRQTHEGWIVDVLEEHWVGLRVSGPLVVLLRGRHEVGQPLRHGGGPTVELHHPSLHPGVPVEPLRLHQVDLYRHDVGEVLAVGGRHVEDPLLDGQPAQVALGAEDPRGLIQVEAAVRVAGYHPVADHVPGVEVEGGEGDDLPAQGQGPGNLAHAGLSLKLKI